MVQAEEMAHPHPHIFISNFEFGKKIPSQILAYCCSAAHCCQKPRIFHFRLVAHYISPCCSIHIHSCIFLLNAKHYNKFHLFFPQLLNFLSSLIRWSAWFLFSLCNIIKLNWLTRRVYLDPGVCIYKPPQTNAQSYFNCENKHKKTRRKFACLFRAKKEL